MNEKLLLPIRLINVIFVMFIISFVFSNLFVKKDPLSVIMLSTAMLLTSSLVTLGYKYIYNSLLKKNDSDSKLLEANGKPVSTKDGKLASKIIVGVSIAFTNFFAYFFLFNMSGIISVSFISYIALYLFLIAASIPLNIVMSIIVKASKD